uniref:Uncharacterized protein n=1 Tax=Myripristis murdjan TaxID=586833 RepID=A0A668ART2_9TELE
MCRCQVRVKVSCLSTRQNQLSSRLMHTQTGRNIFICCCHSTFQTSVKSKPVLTILNGVNMANPTDPLAGEPGLVRLVFELGNGHIPKSSGLFSLSPEPGNLWAES